MTRIEFVLTEDNKSAVMKGIDYEVYKLVRIELCEKDGKANTSIKMKTEINDKSFKIPVVNKESILLRVHLKKVDSSLEKYANKRRYYVKLSKSKEGVTISTSASMEKKSGCVEENTWDESMWKINKKHLIDKYSNILRFYLLNSPAKKDDTLTKQFTDVYALWGENCFKRGDKEQLKAKLSEFKVKGIDDNTGGIASNSYDLKKRVEEFQLFVLKENMLDNMNKEERVVLVIRKKNQYLSLFRHLRNSIAHGSFLIIEDDYQDYFIFQDVDRKKVTARGIISLKILAEWKKIILSKKELTDFD